MAKINLEMGYITYSSNEFALGIPSLDDSNAIGFRLHCILNAFGEDYFYDFLQSFNSDNLNLKNSILDTLLICEFEVWLSYLSLVSNIMGQPTKSTGFHAIVKDIFPLKNFINDDSILIGQKDRYPYIKELKGVHAYVYHVRGKLAGLELLYAKFKVPNILDNLICFDKNYGGHHESDKNKSKSFSKEYCERVMFLNYFKIHNEIREYEKNNEIEFIYEKYKLKNITPNKMLKGKELVLEILFSKKLVPDIELRAFNKRLKSLYDRYKINISSGRPNEDYQFGEFLPSILTGGYDSVIDDINFCFDFDKYKLVKEREDYLIVFEEYCDDIMLYLDIDENESNKIITQLIG